MKTIALALLIGAIATPAAAADISTHVLDLARGVGGKAVPVTLSKRSANGSWQKVGSATTDGDGRIRSFGDAKSFNTGIYRLQFDMSRYPDASASPFFPEITLTFHVTDKAGHYHVPVVVSPYGYSTYRGN
ncbi:hydroxyisourate hydrolase [Sphingomonas sp. S-NIH.Pt15_0812]|jgi:5-hydroxyisourate hydrolase|uniref:hydroxyisourate hydrolase n=1 Tax=Sphingomonas sp. S-NIH.Pt15_0812 TaxID=1920129 RepID=UPI000F7E0517|nr:hydroxyisourate hydrolase [Sphingomonas sp. S-NIH.Pt15_0812]RSU45423.1 hydroxyisourate hydrolase [Sphingomonas sp. S-NIH.Pt15_0812]